MDLESTYLDLRKNIHDISYFNFADLEEEKRGNYEQTEINIKPEELASNLFLYFEEKELILKDLKNISIYVCYNLNLIDKKKYKKYDNHIKQFPINDIIGRIVKVLYKYIEEPALLDNIIEEFVTRIMNIIKLFIQNCYTNSKKIIMDFYLGQLLYILFTLQKIRGSDNIKKYFPHEAKDLCPLILTIDDNKNMNWDKQYILFLWLSVLLLIPFNLEKLDSENLENMNLDYCITSNMKSDSRIMNSVISLLIPYLDSYSKLSQIVGKTLSIFLTRPDVKEKNLYKNFIEYCLIKFDNCNDEIKYIYIVSNLYKTLVYLFDKLQSEDILPYLNTFINLINEEGDTEAKRFINNNLNIRKNKTKFIGNYIIKQLGELKNYWFYVKEKISLENNLKNDSIEDNELITNTEVYEKQILNRNNEHYDNGVSVSEEILDKIEELIEFLISRLVDKENKVRWEAAKIISKITSRLDKQLAYDIINFVLETSENKTEQSYHGVCLCIGEFIKRGLIQPCFLEKISKILFESLSYDHLGIGGTIVRDSACYVIWTLARIYDKSIIEKYFPKIDTNILKVALFDKEGNCRRAASACFQEHVGRVKGYKDGISIISEADYFSVGSIINSYLKVGKYVCHYNQYTNEFINFLGREKIFHSDKIIRKISASALSMMTPLNPESSILNIKFMITKLTTKVFNKKHGLLLGISETLLGLCGLCDKNLVSKDNSKNSIFFKTLTTNDKKLMLGGEYMTEFENKFENIKFINNNHLIDNELKNQIFKIPTLVISYNYLKGKGIDTISESLYRLIYCIICFFDDIDDSIYIEYYNILLEGLKNKQEEYQSVAVKSMKLLLLKFGDKNITFNENNLLHIMSKIEKDNNHFLRRGFIQIIPFFSNNLKIKYIEKIFETIINNILIDKKKNKFNDTDTRKFGIDSLYKLMKYTNLNNNIIIKLFNGILIGLEDYTMNNRGDIGSVVRERSMINIYKFLKFILKLENKETILNIINFDDLCGKIIQQLSEQIDRVRLTAGHTMQLIVDNIFNKIPDFKLKSIIYEKFNMRYLKQKFEEEKEKIFKKYDISLIDDTKFISYKDNNDFIYFWNIAHCNFSIIEQLLDIDNLKFYIIKGICMSYGSLTENTQKEAEICLSKYFENIINGHDKNDVILNFLNIFHELTRLFKRKEKFITPVFKTLNLFLKTDDLFDDKDLKIDNKLDEILNNLYIENNKSKQISKLISSCQLLNSLMMIINIENIDDFKNKCYNIIELFLFHEYPNVNIQMVEQFYIFITLKGELIFEQDINDKLSELMIDPRWQNEKICEMRELFMNLLN